MSPFYTDIELAETPDDDALPQFCICDRNDPRADRCEFCSEPDEDEEEPS